MERRAVSLAADFRAASLRPFFLFVCSYFPIHLVAFSTSDLTVFSGRFGKLRGESKREQKQRGKRCFRSHATYVQHGNKLARNIVLKGGKLYEIQFQKGKWRSKLLLQLRFLIQALKRIIRVGRRFVCCRCVM
jgi:hypothetical protein